MAPWPRFFEVILSKTGNATASEALGVEFCGSLADLEFNSKSARRGKYIGARLWLDSLGIYREGRAETRPFR